MSAPQFALLYLDQRLHAACVVGRRGARWVLALADGRQITVSAGQILFTWPGSAAADGAAAGGRHPADELARRGDLLEQGGAELAARAAAGLPHDRALPFGDVARDTLGDGADGWSQAALFRALLLERRRFRYVGGADKAFVRRGPEALRQHDGATAEEARRERWREAVVAWCDAAVRGRPVPLAPEGLPDALESLLALQRLSPFWGELARPLHLATARHDEVRLTLQRLLKAAGAWRDWPRIWLRAAGVAEAFAPHLLDAAAQAARRPVEPQGRVDYREATTYTIDAPQTRDYDDAVSIVEARPGALSVAVHIAAPFAEWAPGAALFDEAARRMSSVYTAQAMFPMFPETLCTGRLSLLQSAERETLTYVLRLDSGPGELLDVQRAVVRVARNLDYAAAAALVASRPADWGRLAALCGEMRRWRQVHGAAANDQVDVSVDCSDPARLKLVRRDRAGVGSRIIEELSIAYNRLSGAYVRRAGLPALYRVQRAQPQPAAGPGGRRGMQYAPARFALQGGPHVGLACERYVQTTSPVRRFPDLIMQQQIAAHATSGRVIYAEPTLLQTWLHAAEERMGAYGEAERLIADHWKRRYLAQHPGMMQDGEVRGIAEDGMARVWLTELQLHAEGRLAAHMQPGTSGRFRVESVDLDRQAVRVVVAP